MKEQQIKINNGVGSNYIVFMATIFIIFLESVYVILNIFKKGFFKKEVLSKNSNIGFDVKIIMK